MSNQNAKRKFCSKECFRKARKKPIPSCEVCGKPTKRWDLRRCSIRCFRATRVGKPLLACRRRISKNCPQCGSAFEVGGKAGHPWKRFCGERCAGLANRKPLDACLSLNNAAWQELRKKILRRDSYACVFCGHRLNLQVHHLIPRKNGGPHAEANLATACRHCHGSIDRVVAIMLFKNPAFDVAAWYRTFMELPDEKEQRAPASEDEGASEAPDA